MLGPDRMKNQTIGGVATRSRRVDVSATADLTGTLYYNLPAYVTFARVVCSTAMPSWTLYLPFVADAEGMVVTISSSVANSQAVTVADQDDSTSWSDLTLDTDADYVVLYCDGVYWHTLKSGIAG